MKFGIEFVAKQFAQIPGAVVYKSGNPGYMTQLPIIIGENKDFS